MFNKIIKGIKKDRDSIVSKKIKLFEQLELDMSAQYALNKPDEAKQKKIDALRQQCDIERAGLEQNYIDQIEELNIRYMRSEINLLKEKKSMSKTQSVVVDIDGNEIRVYDKSIVGSKFKELAKEFSLKNGYIVKGDKETEKNAKSVNSDKVVEKAVKEEKKKQAKKVADEMKESDEKKEMKKRVYNRPTKVVKKKK